MCIIKMVKCCSVFNPLPHVELGTSNTYPTVCICDQSDVSPPHECDVRECEVRGLGEAPSARCPQMMCGWQGLCQTGRQVALGSHSRTWVLEPCCINPHVTHTQSWQSDKDEALGVCLPVCHNLKRIFCSVVSAPVCVCVCIHVCMRDLASEPEISQEGGITSTPHTVPVGAAQT